jgi:hypothetical protein
VELTEIFHHVRLQLPDDIPGELQVILGETTVYVFVRQDQCGVKKLIAKAEREVGHGCSPHKILDTAQHLLDDSIIPRIRQWQEVKRLLPGVDVELIEQDWRRISE